jgi:hypothetical protein
MSMDCSARLAEGISHSRFGVTSRWQMDSNGNGVADVELQMGKQTVYTGATREFELTVGKRKAYAVVVERWRIVSGAEIEAGESVTDCCGSLATNIQDEIEADCGYRKNLFRRA